MSDINQVMEGIKEAIGKDYWNKKKLLTYLFDLRAKEEYTLSDSEFYDIVGEIFNLNPKIFMIYLYTDLRKKWQNSMELRKDVKWKCARFTEHQ